MLAGLSKWDILRTPPCLCAKATSDIDNAANNDPAAKSKRRSWFMWFTSLCRSRS
jgi:hypothetical protein